MRDYTAETFRPHVGRTLTFEAPAEGDIAARPVCFQLLQVSIPEYASRIGRLREPFSLLFTVAGGEPAARGMHRISHEDFAPCDWLLTRVFVPGKDPGVPYYEAVFG